MWALTAKEMKDCCWLKPKLVAQVEFTEWTPDGHLRHSSFAGLRDDKDARKIQRDKRLTPAHLFFHRLYDAQFQSTEPSTLNYMGGTSVGAVRFDS
jgi:hypothetical protein